QLISKELEFPMGHQALLSFEDIPYIETQLILWAVECNRLEEVRGELLDIFSNLKRKKQYKDLSILLYGYFTAYLEFELTLNIEKEVLRDLFKKCYLSDSLEKSSKEILLS